jgi:itaconyl-CoA hydratase
MADGLTGSTGYFEDFQVGQRIRHARGATIGDFENSVVCKLLMNTAQGHWNEHIVRASPTPSGRIVFGLITGSLVFGLASQDVAENALAELGCNALRFKAPVYHGDTIYALTEVMELRHADRPDAGVARFKHWGVTENGQIVFEGERTILLKSRNWNASRSDGRVQLPHQVTNITS